MTVRLKKVVLRLCWLIGLFHLSRYLMKDKLLILCYHGFETHDETHFRPKLFIKKNTFNERLKSISKYKFPVLTLENAIYKLRNNNLPKNAVTITIDDGFYNVLDVAVDILNRYHFPATLYLTTYYVQKNRPIFRLVVQYMFWKTNKQMLSFDNTAWSKNRNTNVYIDNDNEVERIIWECINFGESKCSEQERTAICQELGELLGVNYQQICDSRIFSLLTVNEAKLVSRRDINIQLHTHRHLFPANDESMAKKEILDNKKVLNEIVDYPIEHFCYPSGMWSKDQWPWLEQMNVDSAATCEAGLNDSETPSFGLKRFLDGENISEIEFLAELFGFMELARELRRRVNIFKNKL